jgi:hypothetical protein
MTKPEQKWIETNRSVCAVLRQLHDALALSSLPPRRTWVGLTDEEKKNIFLKWYGKHWAYTSQLQSVMDSVEAKLKEKNT